MKQRSDQTLPFQLRDTSRGRSRQFEDFFDWTQYTREEGSYYLPPELMSLYGTPLYEMLSPAQIRELGRLEAIQIIYLYAYTESVMCLYLARHLVGSEFGSGEHAFLLREQIEEYRHQDMFLRGLEILGLDFEPMSKWTKWWTSFEALILPKRYFFLLQITIELISREVGKACFQDPNLHPLVRDLCLMHEREEALHIAFSDQYIAKHFASAGFLARTLGGICIALDIAFINHFYLSPAIYQKAGIQSYQQAYSMARKAIRKNPTKNMLTGCARDFLLRYNWITWGNAWIFRLITGISPEKLAKKD